MVDPADYDVQTISNLTGANYGFVYVVIHLYKKRGK